jgi:hypothetical protein
MLVVNLITPLHLPDHRGRLTDRHRACHMRLPEQTHSFGSGSMLLILIAREQSHYRSSSKRFTMVSIVKPPNLDEIIEARLQEIGKVRVLLMT